MKTERDAPKSLEAVHNEVTELIREHAHSPQYGWGNKLDKVLSILEQIVMHLELRK